MKIVALRKAEKKKWQKKLSYRNKGWFGGVLFFINESGEPVEEVAGAKKIPEDALGLPAAFPHMKSLGWTMAKSAKPQSPPHSSGELVTPKTDLESTGELVTPRTALKGCRVRIWRESEYANQSNSEGTILGPALGPLGWMNVQFDDGLKNCYRFGHPATLGVSDLIHVS